MTEELFPASTVTVESPRLSWIRRHSLTLERCDHSRLKFCAWSPFPMTDVSYGVTEDDALADWARRNGVRLWNEEEI